MTSNHEDIDVCCGRSSQGDMVKATKSQTGLDAPSYA